MKIRLLSAAAVLAIVLPSLMGCAEGDNPFNAPEACNAESPSGEPKPKKEWGTVAITAYVENKYAPFNVTGSAVDGVDGKITNVNEVIACGKNWFKILTFVKGHQTTVNITVTASRAGSQMGYLWLVETDTNKKQVSARGQQIFTATLVTKG